MRSYGQYCPIARASEILAERWTPIILRDLLNGRSTFGELAQGAPGLSRTLLATRLRQLESVGVVSKEPKSNGRGWRYALTPMGRDLNDVLFSLGKWGEQWLELAPHHTDPGVVLHSWWTVYLAHDRLPADRVVVRFEFPDRPTRGGHHWFIFDGEDSEVCATDPGFDVDLVVRAESLAFTEWHLGRLEWPTAVRDGRIHIVGPSRLARALPSWNRRSRWGEIRRLAHSNLQSAGTSRKLKEPERF